MFIHSTNGQVMEQDLSAVGHEPLPSLEASIGGVASEEVGTHDDTTNKSMAMDLTLGVESVPSEPNLAAFQQVHVLYAEIVVCTECCQNRTCTYKPPTTFSGFAKYGN